MRRWFCLVALLSSACTTDGPQTNPSPDSQQAADLADATDTSADVDVDPGDRAGELDPDDRVPDGVTTDGPGPVPAGLTALRLDTGERLVGEIVAQYDQSRWWDPFETTTFALFSRDDYADWPDDHSVRLIPSTRVVERQDGPPGDSSYWAFRRSEGFVFVESPLDGVAHVIMGNEDYHLEENGYGDFAWDLVVTNDDGDHFDGDGREVADHYIWDAPVYAPHGGYVIEAVDRWPDNAVADELPDSDHLEVPENRVGISFGGYYSLFMLHLREGSIPNRADHTCEPWIIGVTCIEPGEQIEAGTYLGRVGNSGTSLIPHLHLSALWYDDWGEHRRSWSVPAEWAGMYVSDELGAGGELREYVVPQTGSWISGETF